MEIREWNIRYRSSCLKEVTDWLWDKVQQNLSYNSLRIPLDYAGTGNVGALAVIIPSYPNKNLYQSSCGSLYRKYNLLWNKCLPSIPLPPRTTQTMGTLTDHSGGGFPNTKLGWGQLLNIAAEVPEASAQLPVEPRQSFSLKSAWDERAQTKPSRWESNNASVWLSPVKSLLGDVHSKCL